MTEHRRTVAAAVLAAERERRRQLALDLTAEREAQPDDERVAQEPITEQREQPEDEREVQP